MNEDEKNDVLYKIMQRAIDILTVYFKSKPGYEQIQLGFDVVMENKEYIFIVWKKFPIDERGTDIYIKKYSGDKVSELLEMVISESLGMLFYNSSQRIAVS